MIIIYLLKKFLITTNLPFLEKQENYNIIVCYLGHLNPVTEREKP